MERTCTSLELEKFKDANRNELSMVEVAHAILSQKGDVMAFADLTNAIQEYLGKSDQEIRDRLAQFYTDLNVDGSFISLGDNLWGLRSWYPFESDDDEERELKAYSEDLSDIDDPEDEEDDLPDGIEGQLTELSDADLEDQ